MKKRLNFVVLAIVLFITTSSLRLEAQVLKDTSQIKKLLDQNLELLARMKKSNEQIVVLRIELKELKKTLKENRKYGIVGAGQDSVLKMMQNFNQKLSKLVQTRTAIIYDYNSINLEIVVVLKKTDEAKLVSEKFFLSYENLKYSSRFIDKEFKTFKKEDAKLDPIKKIFGNVEKKFAKGKYT